MSFSKDYPNRKDWRKPWIGKRNYAKNIDKSCRNHRGCPYCEGNRLYQYKKELERINSLLKEWRDEETC